MPRSGHAHAKQARRKRSSAALFRLGQHHQPVKKRVIFGPLQYELEHPALIGRQLPGLAPSRPVDGPVDKVDGVKV